MRSDPGNAAATSFAALLDREEAERARPFGRALDVGCGRGQFTPDLARSGWEILTVEPAETAGLGRPMDRTNPQWYRLRRRT